MGKKKDSEEKLLLRKVFLLGMLVSRGEIGGFLKDLMHRNIKFWCSPVSLFGSKNFRKCQILLNQCCDI